MVKDDKYLPVNCEFHDTLLDMATLKEKCSFKIQLENSTLYTEGKIVDVWTKKGEEFMLLDSGEKYRLDKIILFNNSIVPESNCFVKP